MIRDDPYGRCLLNYYHGRDLSAMETYERSDGYVGVGWGGKIYFSAYEDWPKIEQSGIAHARGMILDLGCGAGRHSLYLQRHGYCVVGIDNSSGAIQVCKEQGLQHVFVLPVTQVRKLPFKGFQTILMLGNNFGFCANATKAVWLLKQLHSITTADGQIIAQTRDPYKTHDEVHLRYQQDNLRRGRMGGQITLRTRYQELVSPWFDYLFVSEAEMKGIVEPAGWHIREVIQGDSDMYGGNGIYIAILEKLPSKRTAHRR